MEILELTRDDEFFEKNVHDKEEALLEALSVFSQKSNGYSHAYYGDEEMLSLEALEEMNGRSYSEKFEKYEILKRCEYGLDSYIDCIEKIINDYGMDSDDVRKIFEENKCHSNEKKLKTLLNY